MAFQPTAFQINAFQWAASNQNRSGVVRLWLAELTAKLNGMLEEEKNEPAPAPDKPELLADVKVQADGSAIITDNVEKVAEAVSRRRRKAVEPVVEDLNVDNPPPPSHTRAIQKEWERRNLPLPEQTADYLVQHFALQAQNSAWAAGRVVELLKLAAAEQAEEDLIIETAASMLL